MVAVAVVLVVLVVLVLVILVVVRQMVETEALAERGFCLLNEARNN
jgi:hypothetical protein